MSGRASFVLLLLAHTAAAQVAVEVDLDEDGRRLAQQIGVTSDQLASEIEEQVNSAYGATNVDGFLRSFTDATAFAMRGLGVDYASVPESLVLGVAANFAVAASGEYETVDRPTARLATNIAFMVGLNLAAYGQPRWTLYTNGFYRTGRTESLRGGIASFGAHVQYRILQPVIDKGTARALRWTGLDVTTGLEYTSWSLGIDDSIVTGFAVEGTSGSANLMLDSSGTFDLASQAVTLPIELSTGIRIAMVATVYVGAGVDFTSSKASLAANLDGDLMTADQNTVGTTTITGGGNNGGSPVAGRVLSGLQLNLWKLRPYVQLSGSTTPAASIGFGVRGVL